MKRHNLLFRYLDGEITRDEDKTLRDIIKNDPELGEDFQSFLEIDYQIDKINNETEYPEDFINEVGLKISNKIVLDNELSIMRKQVRRQYATRFVLIPALIAVVFFTFLISIQNPEINLLTFSNQTLKSKTNSISSTDNKKFIHQSNLPNNKTNITKNSIINYTFNSEEPTQLQKIEQNIDNQSIGDNTDFSSELSIISSNQTDSINQYPYFVSTRQTENNDDPLTQNDKITDKHKFIPKQMQSNALSNNNPYNEEFSINPIIQNITSNIFQTTLINNSNIEINSLFGSDVAQIGVSSANQIVSSFTQSFAAEIFAGTSLGLETGFMEFKANTKKITDISAKPSKSGLNGFSLLEQDNNSSENPVLIRIEGIEVINQRIFWVGFFFERNFLNIQDINISSRISLGATDNGVISSLKLLAKYNLTRGIVLTLGTDARIFEGSFNENQINRINSAFSLIYGVKFTF